MRKSIYVLFNRDLGYKGNSWEIIILTVYSQSLEIVDSETKCKIWLSFLMESNDLTTKINCKAKFLSLVFYQHPSQTEEKLNISSKRHVNLLTPYQFAYFLLKTIEKGLNLHLHHCPSPRHNGLKNKTVTFFLQK